eukprot:PhF_6_TR13663/c0_g1_i1/m.21939/K11416/SIRT6, SIR2L6; mono-ADP-ribosyltransferase sirtuin 6
MAWTAHKTAEAMQEIRDTPEVFRDNVEKVAALIRGSRHTVFYTGAGISTSAGIPDYRGPDGVWTLAAEGKKRQAPTTDMIKAVPTPTHMSMVQLIRNGLAHHVISQNVDGLHRKSGVLPDQISELHGNSCVEVCSDCGRSFLRDYHVSAFSRDHTTGNQCEMPGCGGVLRDNIINFHENLNHHILNRAFAESQKATLHICLGSSLTVKPANELPRCTKEVGGNVVIVNLQRTPLDSIADVRVHSPVDEFMSAVMGTLGLAIPPFELERRVVMWREGGDVKISGVEDDGMPASILRKVDVVTSKGGEVKGPRVPLVIPKVEDAEAVTVKCHFFGHYNEPTATLTLPAGANRCAFNLSYSPLGDAGRDGSGPQWVIKSGMDYAPPNFTPVEKRARTATTTTEQPRMPQVTDFTGWHAVTPLEDCPHTRDCVGFKQGEMVDLQSTCSACGNVGENMICLSCKHIGCGRHVNSHMVAHNAETGHNIVCGFMDLSFWCYQCEAYISPSNPKLRPYYQAMHVAKFGTLPFA